MKILVVDDNEPSHFLIAVWVARAAGFDLNFATNGDEALRCYAKRGPYDVVLTDIVHPGLDGLALSKAIRRKNPRQPIAIFTGGMSDSAVRSFQRLNIPVLLKPHADWQELSRLLKAAMTIKKKKKTATSRRLRRRKTKRRGEIALCQNDAKS